jgi:protocatechuate 3,4-dioxygenase beta subunit
MKRNRICIAIIIFLSLSIHCIGQNNIPSTTKINAPSTPTALDTNSGLAIGEYNPSFNPFHAWGPDKDTRICMACNYGRYHGIMYFVGNHPNWGEIKLWLTYFEKESNARNKYLKVYFIYANEIDYVAAKREKELEDLGKELHIQQLALTYVPSLTDKESEVYQN